MSPPYKIRLSNQAEIDFEDILLYTLTTWGDEQMLQYRDGINKAMESLAVHPLSGTFHEPYLVNYLSIVAGSHIILYKYKDDAIFVSRILHQ